MRFRFYLFILTFLLIGGTLSVAAQKRRAPPVPERSVTIVTEPGASVWLNTVSRGVTNETGRLLIKPLPAGKHTLKIRADGFGELIQDLTATQKGEIKIVLKKTSDEAELAFQQAENAFDPEEAIGLYQRAIQLRPKYAEAYIQLARLLAGQGLYEDAHDAIARARKILPADPVVSAVEGRVFISEGDEEGAITAYKRSIREGRGFQPEANTGLALLYKDRAESFAASGDFQGEEVAFEESVKYFAPAVKQLAGAPDAVIVYQLYGLVLERMHRYQEAIKVYEEFLKFFPDIGESESVRSFIVQLKKQLADG